MVLAFSLLMIFMTSIIFIVNQDIRETKMQEERLQTYYIALTGIDLTYAALMDPSYNPKKFQTAITKLKGNSNTPLTDSITIEVDGEVKGTADVSIKRVNINDIDWLQITSVGKLAGKNTLVTSTMRINEANPNQMVREKFGE